MNRWVSSSRDVIFVKIHKNSIQNEFCIFCQNFFFWYCGNLIATEHFLFFHLNNGVFLALTTEGFLFLYVFLQIFLKSHNGLVKSFHSWTACLFCSSKKTRNWYKPNLKDCFTVSKYSVALFSTRSTPFFLICALFEAYYWLSQVLALFIPTCAPYFYLQKCFSWELVRFYILCKALPPLRWTCWAFMQPRTDLNQILTDGS